MGSHLSTAVKDVFDFIIGFGSPAELEVGQSERNKASYHAKERGLCFDKSKQCYAQGDHAGAKQLSLKGREHDSKEKEFNAKAAHLIFEYHNKGRSIDSIDLHGLFVREAVDMVRDRIKLCKQQKVKRFNVIVGKGLHSQNGIARLRPAIIDLVQEYQLKCSLDPRNEGCLIVEFVDSRDKAGIVDLSRTCLIQ